MGITRRQLSVGCGVGALAWTVGRLRPGEIHAAPLTPEPLDLGQLKQLAAFALERARAAGASYADIRINRYQQQMVALRSQPDFSSGKLEPRARPSPQ